jgi:hypothetical protein
MKHWMVPPEWMGETAFLLGCGPSLNDVPVERLRGRIIAINDAYLKAPWADVLYFCDLPWWRKNQHEVREVFRGRRIVTMINFIPGVHTLRCTGEEGLDTDPGALRSGLNGGFQAIHLAYHFGAKRIVLLGYDMRAVLPVGRESQNENKLVHWRPRTGDNAARQEHLMRTRMLPKFNSLTAPLAAAGVQVVNCTPGSALRVWPQVPLSEVLAWQG